MANSDDESTAAVTRGEAKKRAATATASTATNKTKRAGGNSKKQSKKKKKAADLPPALAPPPTPGKGQGQRNPNFMAPEWSLIARAFVNTTDDPVVGADQNSNEFWDKCAHQFDKLSKAENAGQYLPREKNAL